MSKTFDDYARYYDLFYGDKDYAGEATYVLDIVSRHLHRTELPESLQILELGCGTGRHAEQFVAAGCTVFGVDSSAGMIARATDRLRGTEAAHFEVGDATSLSLGRSFDLVVALFHVLSYQTADDAVIAFFRTAATHLRSGGIAVFDFWHGPGVLTDPPTTRVRRLASETLDVVRIAEPTVHAPANNVDVNYTLFFKGLDEKTWGCAKEAHRMRYFFLPELKMLQELSGLSPVCFYPWMALTGDPDRTHWHAVMVGKKS